MRALHLLVILSIVSLFATTAYAQETSPKENTEAAESSSEGKSKSETEDGDVVVEEAPEKDEKDEDVVAERLAQNDFRVGRPISTVTAEEIRRKQSYTLSDALKDQPGVSVASYTTGGAGLILRGVAGASNTILFDGVRFNQSTQSNGVDQTLDLINPNAIDSARVVRGPVGVLYGPGSLGGAVLLQTKDIENTPFYHAMAGLRTADWNFRAAAEASLRSEDKRYQLNLGGGVDVHNNLRHGSLFNSGLVIPDSNKGKLDPSQYQKYFWFVRGQVAISDQAKLRLDYHGGAHLNDQKMFNLGRGRWDEVDNYDHLAYATFEYDGDDFLDQIRWNVSFHRGSQEDFKFKCLTYTSGARKGTVPVPHECATLKNKDLLEWRQIDTNVTTSIGTSLTWLSDIPGVPLNLMYGADLYFDVIQSSRLYALRSNGILETKPRGNFTNNSKYLTSGVYAVATYEPFRSGEHSMTLSLGARGNIVWASAPPSKGRGIAVADEVNALSYLRFDGVGDLSVNYFYGDLAHAYLTFSEGFRPPSYQELAYYGDLNSEFQVPNTALNPERSDTLTVGAKTSIADLFTLDVNAFFSLLVNPVLSQPATYKGLPVAQELPVRTPVNAHHGYLYGAELNFTTAPIYNLTFRGNATWYDGVLFKRRQGGQPQPGIIDAFFYPTPDTYANPSLLAPAKFMLGVDYTIQPGLFVGLWSEGALGQGKLSTNELNDLRFCQAEPGVTPAAFNKVCQGSPAWGTLNARAGWSQDGYFVNVALNNILDMKYRRFASGVTDPGVNFMITLGIEGY